MNDISVSVIVPIRNEERYIEDCLQSLLRQTYPSASYEIIVLDGRSSDGSREIVDGLCRDLPRLYCIDNPAGTAPAAMNIGIRHAKGGVIIRADGHNFYPADYIENCVKCLEQTGADNVGGPWMTVPADNSLGARLVAAMLSNPFGVGDSRFRISSKEGFVETVPFGAFRREVFDRVGMYNEKLVRNQDNELNARIRRAGGTIYQTPTLQTTYHPVAGFLQLLTQT
jgi:glycosyltransferase involved in cell wall biosynthesis